MKKNKTKQLKEKELGSVQGGVRKANIKAPDIPVIINNRIITDIKDKDNEPIEDNKRDGVRI